MSNLTPQQYLNVVQSSKLVERDKLAEAVRAFRQKCEGKGEKTLELAQFLEKSKLLTPWQNRKLLDGRYQGFVAGKYKLLSHIGSGGMSKVYLAEHIVMRRRVAIKVLPEYLVNNKECLERFYIESQATAALDHPNIVRAYDVDNEENIHYMVMEYVQGLDLERIVQKKGPCSYEDCAHYILQAADGLAHAHSKGMVHRDVKPANLLVDQNGTVKILDMGLADFEGNKLSPKGGGNVMGTTDFLAPEQALGSATLDARADIYSLGCTMYFLLVGKAPFGGSTLADVLLKHQTQEPKPIPQIREDCPRVIWSICKKMMAKKPEDRYQNALHISNELAKFITHGDEMAAASLSGKRTIEETKDLVSFLSQLNNDREERINHEEPRHSDESLSGFLAMLDSEPDEASTPSPSNTQRSSGTSKNEEATTFLSSLNLGSPAPTTEPHDDELPVFDFTPVSSGTGGSSGPRKPPVKRPPPADSVATPPPSKGATPKPQQNQIQFLCPQCKQRLFGPSSLQGKAGKCPHCGSRFRIPQRTSTSEGSGSGKGTDSGLEAQNPPPSATPPPSRAASKPETAPNAGDDMLDQFFKNLGKD